MALREYMCSGCSHIFEEVVYTDEDYRSKRDCPHCETKTAEYIFSAHGGYSMNSGGSSTKPKGSGSFKRSKLR